MTGSKQDTYIKALRFDRLTVFYDAVLRSTIREDIFKTALVRQVQLQARQQVLDLGCGTGTLTLSLKRRELGAYVIGLDGDYKALTIAQGKFTNASVLIYLNQGLSFALPYQDCVFDRVVSSLLFHHLTREKKLKTLQEIFRVLKPGGELHIADWGKPHRALMRQLFFLIQLLDGFETTTDNVRGLLPDICRQANFEPVTETQQFATVFGTIGLLRAHKPN